MFVVAVTACERGPKTPEKRGEGIYVRSCSGCHGHDGRGIARPGLAVPPRNLSDETWQASVSDDDIKKKIRVGKNQMPAFGGLLSDQDLGDLVTFIRTLPNRRR